MGYIYLITNSVNNKNYVGQTSFSINERWRQHLADSRKKDSGARPLYRAIRKHGSNNFSIKILEEVQENDLAKREQFWIAFYQGYELGYNATRGGDGKCFYDHQEIAEMLLEKIPTSKIVEKIGCDKAIVYKVADSYNIEITQTPPKGIPVIQCDKQGNYLRNFDSFANAARWLIQEGYAPPRSESGIRSHISAVIKGTRKSAYQFIWKVI